METLRCNGLSKAFGGVQALSHVDLAFASSGITAIIGPNGAGKTTLLNILTGFLRPDAGRCFVGSRETTWLPAYMIARLSVARTFQELRLILELPIIENVLLAASRRRDETLLAACLRFGASKEEARNRNVAQHVLEFVGLADRASELAGELSYGQQKLLTLACCFATGATILLLDEPIAGVHPEIAQRILSLLRELRDRGKLIVFIEHDIGAVRQVADNLVVMDHGKIIAEGAPQVVLARPEITEAYLG